VYVSEHGLIPAFVLHAFPMREEDVRSRVIETAVLRHVLDLVESRDEIFYYRRGDDLEIDFVFSIGKELWAIEVTSTPEPGSRKITRFMQAADEIGAQRRFIVHGGTIAARQGEAQLVPLHAFLLDPSGALEPA
jgi:predicted AAA+ superfamily ATPase